MNIERSILISFLGNYLINTVIAAFMALIPGGNGGFFTPQYMTFTVVAVIVVSILTWWLMQHGKRGWLNGLVFGAVGFVVSIVTVVVANFCGVLAQTGSLSSAFGILPNFWPFLTNWPTLVLLCYWIIPATLVGWFLKPKMSAVQRPMMGSMNAAPRV